MNLDKRIKSLSDVLTCYDIEKSKQFIGQEGYFTDRIEDLTVLSYVKHGTLTEVYGGCLPFREGEDDYYRFFIPDCRLNRIEENQVEEKLNLNEIMKEIKDLKNEIDLIKSQLNKSERCFVHSTGYNPQSNCCVSIKYPDGFNPQGNWCKNEFR